MNQEPTYLELREMLENTKAKMDYLENRMVEIRLEESKRWPHLFWMDVATTFAIFSIGLLFGVNSYSQTAGSIFGFICCTVGLCIIRFILSGVVAMMVSEHTISKVAAVALVIAIGLFVFFSVYRIQLAPAPPKTTVTVQIHAA